MRKEQWDAIRHPLKQKTVPTALIVDSPWIPSYCGIDTIDYFTNPEIWWNANIKIKNDFPDVIFVPDFWVEYGMAAEPSGFGCKTSFYKNTTPNVHHLVKSCDDIENLIDLPQPNPKTDGLMPFALSNYKFAYEKAGEIGEQIKIVAARGPLTTASHMMGLSEFLVAVKIYPEKTHKLIKKTAQLTIDWLNAQSDCLPDAEGILVLDDVVGMLSEEDYLEFAYPYMKEIFGAFPNVFRMYHNDTDNPACYKYLDEMGIDAFNFTHMKDIALVRQLVGERIILMGNVAPLDILAKGNAQDVKTAAEKCMEMGAGGRFILSAGGGTSPGTPKENITALAMAAKNHI